MRAGSFAFAFALVLAFVPAASASVAIVDVQHDARTLAERPFDASVTLRNDGDAPTTIDLFAALYEPAPGRTCGPSTDARFRGFTPLVQARITLPPHGEGTYPPTGDRWLQRYHAKDVPMGPATFEWCVFAAKDATGATIQYDDLASRPLSVRARNAAPTASFRVEPAEPVAAREARLVAEGADADGDPLTFSWDFGQVGGDASPVRGASVTHAFFPAGTYSVILRVSDGSDASTSQRDVWILEENTPSAAKHTVSAGLVLLVVAAAGLARLVTRVPPKLG